MGMTDQKASFYFLMKQPGAWTPFYKKTPELRNNTIKVKK